jgi:16S rRNA (guanine527-N7)-methyltransferase
MSGADDFSGLLKAHFSPVGTLTPAQLQSLHGHYQLLSRWNKVLNLTSVRSMEEAVRRHYCESLFLATHLPPEPLSVLDIGSGAGFPGIPMAIFRPDCHFTLAESHRRKAVFLREASRDLPNVQVVAERAEELTERFDWVVSRAVAWKQLRRVVGRLGRRLALLLGEQDVAGVQATAGFGWQVPIPVPWTRQSFLLVSERMFHVEHS